MSSTEPLPAPVDSSEGWDDVADRFIAIRSAIGAELVRSWSRKNVPPSGAIIDIGCGSGVPISQTLIDEGFEVYGIDAAPKLVAAYRERFPKGRVVCQPAQDSDFFNRTFDAAVCVGLLFLLAQADQVELIRRTAAALKSGGRFLFSAPRERCEWQDTLTGRPSKSLGLDGYETALRQAGLAFVGCQADEGQNNFYDAVKVS